MISTLGTISKKFKSKVKSEENIVEPLQEAKFLKTIVGSGKHNYDQAKMKSRDLGIPISFK